MHTYNPTNHLWVLAMLGIAVGAILTSSIQQKKLVQGLRNVAAATKDLTVERTAVKGQNSVVWQRLKIKSEGQIKDNGTNIRKFKEQRTKTSKAFRATYDRRTAELERRNVALKGKLNNYKGYRGESWVDYK